MLSALDVYKEATGCQEHPITCVTSKEVAEAITIMAMGRCNCTPWNDKYSTCGSYCDTESFALARLKDGRFLYVSESSDSSGHG